MGGLLCCFSKKKEKKKNRSKSKNRKKNRKSEHEISLNSELIPDNFIKTFSNHDNLSQKNKDENISKNNPSFHSHKLTEGRSFSVPNYKIILSKDEEPSSKDILNITRKTKSLNKKSNLEISPKSHINSILENNPIKNEKNASLKRSGNYKIFKTNNDLIVKCPHCITNIEYESGCYFMTCSSYICKSKKIFCFICQSKLYLSDKKHHFPNGIYNLSSKNKI